ncbi:hypothetical protein GR198_08310 [Rhizobium leguminosarum]|uniref:hypothetical protein n=1 Tax=Rhizobium leguminosarum TaxID=384 RepID=UPI0013C29818|nr:hypothetical protein [Rhizobium leguminosarum]NEH55738.1 hypothetical protein [Rhizobium leguminosarum]
MKIDKNLLNFSAVWRFSYASLDRGVKRKSRALLRALQVNPASRLGDRERGRRMPVFHPEAPAAFAPGANFVRGFMIAGCKRGQIGRLVQSADAKCPFSLSFLSRPMCA